jgi:uncharacterized membrane protein
MTAIQESIEVDVPLTTAYNQWTQFEEFPRFMEGVESIQQLDDRRLHWVAAHGGKRHEWDAEIVDQTPDTRIAWRDVKGKMNAGEVTFERLGEARTRVDVHMDWEPEGVKEEIGTLLGFDKRRVKADLARFKEFIEERGRETGAWRGDIGGQQ